MFFLQLNKEATFISLCEHTLSKVIFPLHALTIIRCIIRVFSNLKVKDNRKETFRS
ncbi:hypothetical protein NEOC65_000633 [Neochlamydia sp. AcF65]|nr:hypothetical protein [Neochlamydia sp. AcF65]MBS4169593.1 hypothetical protein [Neochlamydia sp. AcF95]